MLAACDDVPWVSNGGVVERSHADCNGLDVGIEGCECGMGEPIRRRFSRNESVHLWFHQENWMFVRSRLNDVHVVGLRAGVLILHYPTPFCSPTDNERLTELPYEYGSVAEVADGVLSMN